MNPAWVLIGIFGLCVVISAIIAGVFYLLYNGIVSPVFSWPQLTYLQSWGIWLLLSMIGGAFKSDITNKG